MANAINTGGYFGRNAHWRMESVDRGAVYNENIASFPANPGDAETYELLGARVSSQNPRDQLKYGVEPDTHHETWLNQIRRNRDFIIPQTLKVFPKSMAYIRVEGSGDNVTFRRYTNTNEDSIFCTKWDYGFPGEPDTDNNPTWEPGCRYIGGLFVDQSQNNPL